MSLSRLLKRSQDSHVVSYNAKTPSRFLQMSVKILALCDRLNEKTPCVVNLI